MPNIGTLLKKIFRMNNRLGINLWNSFDSMSPHEKNLRNTTHQWSGMDTHETCIRLQQQNTTTYTEDDFFYKFNSLGFRSNEFDNTEDIKILYAGCSVTEGTGLPVNHIWASFLNDRISKETNKPISSCHLAGKNIYQSVHGIDFYLPKFNSANSLLAPPSITALAVRVTSA